MPSTNKTTPYNLPQYSAGDYPSFTKEITDAFKTINDTMKTLDESISAAESAATTAQEAASTAQQAASTAQTAANNAVALLVELGVTDEESAAAFKSAVDNAIPKHAVLAEYFDSAD